jgi:hypothetical protein
MHAVVPPLGCHVFSVGFEATSPLSLLLPRFLLSQPQHSKSSCSSCPPSRLCRYVFVQTCDAYVDSSSKSPSSSPSPLKASSISSAVASRPSELLNFSFLASANVVLVPASDGPEKKNVTYSLAQSSCCAQPHNPAASSSLQSQRGAPK